MSDDRIYRKVEIDVWDAPDFLALSKPKPNARTLWLWLLSCRRTVAIPGVIRGRLSAMAGDLEWPVRSFKKCLAEIVAAGMAEVDEEAGLVVLTKALLVDGKPRPTARPRTKNAAKSWGDAYIKLPTCALRDSLTVRLRSFFDQIGGEISSVFAERVGWSTGGDSTSPPVESAAHHGTQGSGIRKKEDPDLSPVARARDEVEPDDPPKATGTLIDHAIDRLNAERRKVDPSALPIPLTPDRPCRDLLDHLRTLPPDQRRQRLDAAIDVMFATLRAENKPVGEYRMAMLSGPNAWPRWRDGTVEGAATSARAPPRSARPNPDHQLDRQRARIARLEAEEAAQEPTR